jgi:hypothetical protein
VNGRHQSVEISLAGPDAKRLGTAVQQRFDEFIVLLRASARVQKWCNLVITVDVWLRNKVLEKNLLMSSEMSYDATKVYFRNLAS